MMQQWMCYFLNIIIFIVIHLYSIEIFFQQILPELKSIARSKTPLPHCICICITVAGPRHLSLYFSKCKRLGEESFQTLAFYRIISAFKVLSVWSKNLLYANVIFLFKELGSSTTFSSITDIICTYNIEMLF